MKPTSDIINDIIPGRPDGLEVAEQITPKITVEQTVSFSDGRKPNSEPEKPQEYKRPQRLSDFIGNSEIREQLQTTVQAIRKMNRRLPNAIFFGAAGTGKTTLAKILGNEVDQPCITITGNSINKQEDLMKVIWRISDIYYGTGKTPILFIDEIGSISFSKDLDQTIWLPLIEDFVFYNNLEGKIIEYKDTAYKILTGEYKVPEFTVIGATTDIANLNPALRRRFPLHFFMKPYTPEELQKILLQYSGKKNIPLTEPAALNIAKRSRFTPATALSYLEACEYYQVGNSLPDINDEVVNRQMSVQKIDSNGLKWEDMEVLRTLAEFPKGMGLKNLASAAGISADVVEEIVEPFLKSCKLMAVVNKRIITQKGIEYIQKGENNGR
ncbi:MAG: AAA family ATPase [Patescibacteria group bacterium]